jgi:chloramphenicol-sensitive protein RarD
LLLLLASTLAIAINWFVFIWAVAHGQLLGASLGYFINPLVTVMLGLLVLGERLRVGQAIALVLAACAVSALVVAERSVPIVPLSLAFSFASYALLRKQAVVAPIIGLFVETMLLLPFALWVIVRQVSTQHTDSYTYALLAMSGLITALPLIWFSAAARRLRLATMGFLQYLSPTGQFLLGRFAYHEPLHRTKLLCFAVVWVALLIFTIDSLRAYRRMRVAAMSSADDAQIGKSLQAAQAVEPT